jgi:thioredoxin-related protein
MKHFWYIILCAPLYGQTQDKVSAQGEGMPGVSAANNTTGIRWINSISFQEVQEKAIKENKFIFLDCYATWCGPCKEMDKNVFVNDSIGNFFNQHFISIKVQMDKTKKDIENVKLWYDDATSISKKYRIDRFPSYLFFSPQGNLVGQEAGFKKISEFLGIAQSVIRPGRVYNDIYAEYDQLVAEFKQGKMHYDRMVYMIGIARRFDTALVRPLSKQYAEYVSRLDVSKRYTKENIAFWNMRVLKSDSKTFRYFYNDGKLIDRVMQQKGYAAAVVDKTIYHELIVPFLKEQNTNPAIRMTGLYMNSPDVKTDSSEADWKKLENMVRKKFDDITAKRNVLAAKIEWYNRHSFKVPYAKYLLLELDTYKPDVELKGSVINIGAWTAFLHINDKSILNGYLKWMHKLVIRYPENGYIIDTYANLLYKLGRKKDAIYWEEKAILTGNGHAADYRNVLEQMKRGEPTYGVNIIQ